MRLIVARGRQSMATRTTVSSRGHGTASFIGDAHDLPIYVDMARDHGPVYDRLHAAYVLAAMLE